MDFQKFRFRDLRASVLRRNIVFSEWLGFHMNTEFKARAAFYHVERFEAAYKRYLEVQAEPDSQMVYGLEHPLKEIVFFEFLATVANLIGCFDSMLQEVNCACRLGLTPTRQKVGSEVSLGNVLGRLKKLDPDDPIRSTLERLVDKKNRSGQWFRFLKTLRNTAIHSDLYSTSYEERNIAKILSALDEKAKAGEIQSAEDLKKVVKRDVVFSLEGRQYYMIGLLQWLRDETVGFVDRMHELLEA